MNNEQIAKLLEEARIKYPKGTVFRSSYQGDIATSLGDCYFEPGNIDGHKEIFINGNKTLGMNGWFYSNGKWAEIVSLPEPKFINYEIC